ncbi:Response regulator receiver domain-containing protein [Flavobacteriaceae bacterium MAR_2010_188]|nr:Response regulator receiver domain-containing protein [Flavobacteriaceae bacterium MAR_2010_188]
MATDFLRIILVDDDEDDRILFSKAIDELKINTDLLMFEDGYELLDHLNDDPNLPSIIFLDLNMPIINGMDCLREIRSNQKYSDISIAIYSTSSSENDIDQTFIHGANVYINKPYNYNKLKDTIDKVLKINWQYFNSSLNKETFLLRL